LSNKKSGIGKTIKRELVRAILERSQSMDVNGMAPAAVGSEAEFYDDVEQQLNIPYINRDEVPLAMDVFKPLLPEGTELVDIFPKTTSLYVDRTVSMEFPLEVDLGTYTAAADTVITAISRTGKNFVERDTRALVLFSKYCQDWPGRAASSSSSS
jgi:hypothetical protein